MRQKEESERLNNLFGSKEFNKLLKKEEAKIPRDIKEKRRNEFKTSVLKLDKLKKEGKLDKKGLEILKLIKENIL